MTNAVKQIEAIESRSAGVPSRPTRSGLNITVLHGGIGPEREVSLQSGIAVAEALTRRGHSAVLCDLTPDRLDGLDRVGDLAFIALHGAFGEDGTLQRELDGRGIRYCGADGPSSLLAMDKVATKKRCIEAGIPTPPYEVVAAARRSEGSAFAPTRVQPPAVVKPVDSGSSVDTFICRTPQSLTDAVDRVADRYGRAMVEAYVQGPELTVGILNGQALPVCQIRTRREFYDYQAKYIDDDTEYLFDIDLPAATLLRVQELSRQAFDALGCRDFGRVDWMVDASTGTPYFLEVNTIPGFTSHSLLPKAAARVGLSFDDLCQQIVELTLRRPAAGRVHA